MAKQLFTHYYVQAKKENQAPEIVYHTYDKKSKEYFHKFFDRKKAQELAEAEKKLAPDVNFRVVKVVETYDAGSWF